MKIIRRKSDNVVTHIVDDSAILSKNGTIINNVLNISITPSTAEILAVGTLPDVWNGEYYTYIEGTWTPTNIGEKVLLNLSLESAHEAEYNKTKIAILNDWDITENMINKAETIPELRDILMIIFRLLSLEKTPGLKISHEIPL